MSFLRKFWNTTVAPRRYSVTTRCCKWLPRFFRWRPTSEAELEKAEGRILDRIYRVSDKKFVKLPKLNPFERQQKLWTIVANKEEKTNIPLVMVHGMGGGVGLWVQNIDSLAEKRPVYAFDLLGFGRSSRPRSIFGFKEKEFVESIEEWRKEMKIDKMILMGHSLGAYVVGSYAEKYPDNIRHLFLIDPCGFLPVPDNFTPPWSLILVTDIMTLLVNPMTVFRIAGPLGPCLVKIWCRNIQAKFSKMFDDDTILEYFYHCNAQRPPSGETAFRMLSPFHFWVEGSMLDRIGDIDKEIPITFVYGSESWLDTYFAYSAIAIRGGSRVNLEVIKGADHHVYADKPDDFNKVMDEYLDSIDKNKDKDKVYINRVPPKTRSRQWLAEDRIFNRMKSNFEKMYVKLSQHHTLWTIVANKDVNTNIPLVMLHGMAGGVGLWCQNIDSFAKKRPVYAFDLLGFGQSSRPKFSRFAYLVENEFVESLEEWRKEMKIDKMIIMGHNLGAYIASCYALKYPDKVQHLFLTSPWGFNENTDEDRMRRKVLAKLFSKINPQDIFRAAGPISPYFIKTFRGRDKQVMFGQPMFNDEAILDYIDQCNDQKLRSGETAFKTLATRFRWAKKPMIRRLIDKKLPITFVFGSETWMDTTCGDLTKNIRDGQKDKRHGSTVDLEVIEGAGHHVYADKPYDFNKTIGRYLDAIDKQVDNVKSKRT